MKWIKDYRRKRREAREEAIADKLVNKLEARLIARLIARLTSQLEKRVKRRLEREIELVNFLRSDDEVDKVLRRVESSFDTMHDYSEQFRSMITIASETSSEAHGLLHDAVAILRNVREQSVYHGVAPPTEFRWSVHDGVDIGPDWRGAFDSDREIIEAWEQKKREREEESDEQD